VERKRISLQPEEKKRATRRSPWDKEGKFRYLNRKLDAVRRETRQGFRHVEKQLRIILNCLAPFLEIDSDYLISVVCRDEGDRALLHYLRSKGSVGITPTGACGAEELERFLFKPFHVTRRIQRMNKRLEEDIGKSVAASYNRRWVITRFAQRAFNATKEETNMDTNGS
jgi:hypothetical protein